MEKRQPGVVRNEINLGVAEARHVHDVFHHTRRWLAADIHNLKIVPVQVEWMAVSVSL